MTTVMDLPTIYANAQAVKQDRQNRRIAPPLVRLWDGNWALRGICNTSVSGDFKWLLNESGTGVLVLPYDDYLAKWAVTTIGSGCQNVHITVDKDGGRWGGRMQDFDILTDDHGVTTIQLNFLHDYEELKHVWCWANPFLPAAFQFPRNLTLAMPSMYGLKMMLFLNVLRLESSLWALPDDPLDTNQWFDLDQSTWSMVVAPSDFVTDESLWAIINTRWQCWHELAAPILDYAQLAVTTRRWLTGDPAPWPGAVLRHGCLVVDIVDKSGFYTGTSQGGNVITGLEYTVEVIANDFLNNQSNILPDPNDPSQYVNPGWIGTLPNAPWVIYRPELHTGVQTADFKGVPFTDIQYLSGGHSMPGVNEAITAAVQMAGGLLGAAIAAIPIVAAFGGAGVGVLASELGNIAVSLLSPIYTDVVLAWVSFKDPVRAFNAGWSHYFEHFQTGADTAYTLDSLIALIAAEWATRSFYSHKLTIANGQPFFIGDQGQGDFFIGDRIGSTCKGMPPGEIFVDQVTQLDLTWSRTTTPTWAATIGTNKEVEEPLAKALGMIQGLNGQVQQLSVNS